MNIGIDITPLIYRRGVSRYTSNLTQALAQQKNLNLRLLGYSLRQKQWLLNQASQITDNAPRHQTKVQLLPQSLQKLLWRLRLNQVSNQFPDLDLFHSWDWLQPPDQNLPLVSTIHDLAILKYPQTAKSNIVKAHRASWQILKKRKAHIIAVSQSTKKDVIQLLKIPPWRVHVVPEALPEEIRQISQNLTEEEYDQIVRQLKLDQPYILFVGTREPRKNLLRLIKAWQPLANDYQLLVAGAAGWDETSADQAKFSHPSLRFLGRVSDQELNVLYAQAEVFAYPSLYEGFGLPILEAFYHGTPVLTSNISSMIEVAGNAAELIDPEDVMAIRQGLENLLNETKEEQQKRLQRMVIRQQMFSWDKVAMDTIKVYQIAIDEWQSEQENKKRARD
ncbi:MAG: glycosyltransferase [Candidatus Pacebacteria bacterium]|nr:glycosyltransferase [Candidatus Paceibacterota bacterium]